MKEAPIPNNEIERLLALREYEVLDTVSENVFDEITSLASLICGTQISLISLVDENRQWFKSKVNLAATETPRDISYCGHAIMQDNIFEINDSSKDDRFKDNPLHTDAPHVNFYAGAPLITPSGYKIGTLCVIDPEPKKLSDIQKETLKILSKHVIKILELQLKNRELENIKNHFHDVQVISKTGGWEFDIINNHVHWSDEVYRIHGVKVGTEVPLDEAINFYAPHERDKLSKLMEMAMTQGKSFNDIFEFYSKDNRKKWVRSIGSPFKNDKGEIIKLSGTFQDVTDHIEIEKELNHNNRLKSIGELAAGIGHEINNPLTLITANIDKLASAKENEVIVKKSSLENLKNSANRIKNIVSGLRTFARKDQEDTKRTFNPILTLQETIDLLKEIYKADQITIKSLLPQKSSNIFIRGDRGKFQQIVINILNNSKDALKSSKEKIINITVSLNNESFHLTIKDTGIGIPKEIRTQIFSPFFTTKDIGEGTGIGLSLVHKFVKEMNGNISLSENDKTEFILEFPTTDELFIDENLLTQSRTQKNYNILIVDDEEGIRDLLVDIVEDKGHSTITAANGQEALKIFTNKKDSIDLIISDIQMPKMTGIELLREIKAIDPNMKMVLVTGGVNLDLDDTKLDFYHLIDDKIFKPFTEKQIHETIKSVKG